MNSYYSAEEGFFMSICKQAIKIFDDAISALYKQDKRVIKVLEVGAGMSMEYTAKHFEANVLVRHRSPYSTAMQCTDAKARKRLGRSICCERYICVARYFCC
jgi:hypothetical protein